MPPHVVPTDRFIMAERRQVRSLRFFKTMYAEAVTLIVILLIIRELKN